MYRWRQYYSECFICTVDMPFVDVSPQICPECRKARPEIAPDGPGKVPRDRGTPPEDPYQQLGLDLD